MRVFISYGRQDGAEFANDLADWLEARGHEAWLDVRNGVPIGTAFDLRIEQGITESDVVVFLLTAASRRPESFCRNELLLAKSLGRPIVPIRLGNVSPPVQIVSLNYIDAVANPKIAFDYLDQSLESVSRAKEVHLQTHAPGSPREPWWSSLRVPTFDHELRQHGGAFVGREWLFARIQDWASRPNSRLFLLVGTPGAGKSAIAAQASARCNALSVHFCTASKPESCTASALLHSVVYYLAAQLPPYAQRIRDLPRPNRQDRAETLFRLYVTDPLLECEKEIAVDAPYLFVVDGLDESVAEAGPELCHLLSHAADTIPSWLRILVTTRPDDHILATLNRLNVTIEQLEDNHARNCEDVRAYIQSQITLLPLDGLSHVDRELVVARLATAAQGNFLYGKIALQLSTEDPNSIVANGHEKLPKGLSGLYYEMFLRRFKDQSYYARIVKPVLSCLVAARAPLPRSLLSKAANAPHGDLDQALSGLRQFLVGRADRLALSHASLADWLRDSSVSAQFSVDQKAGHNALSDALWQTRELRGKEPVLSYGRAHLAVHLAKAESWDRLCAEIKADNYGLLRRWVERGRGDQGLLCLKPLLKHLWHIGRSPSLAAKLATQIGRIHVQRGEYDRAKQYLEHRAPLLSSWWYARKARAVAFHELGSMSLYQGRFGKALLQFARALFLSICGLRPYYGEIAGNLHGIASIAFERNFYNIAAMVAWIGWMFSHAAGDHPHRLACLSMVAAARRSQGKLRRAKKLITVSEKLGRRYHLPIEAARSLLVRGWLEFDEATLEDRLPRRAERFFAKAMLLSRRIGHESFYCQARLGLGWCAAVAKKTPIAEAFFSDLLTRLSPREHHELIAGAKLGLAEVAYQQGAIDDAIGKYGDLLRFCDQNGGIPVWRAHALFSRGALYWHLGNVIDARRDWANAEKSATLVSSFRLRLIQRRIQACSRDASIAP